MNDPVRAAEKDQGDPSQHDLDDGESDSSGGKPRGHLAEPRKLTLSDLLAVTFGFALFFSLPSPLNLGGLAMYGIRLPLWFLILLWTILLLIATCLATSSAVLLRRFKYGQQPSATEWLALIISMHFLSQLIPNVDTCIDRVSRAAGVTPDFDLWRWATAAIGLGLATLLTLLARRFFGLARTMLLCATSVILLWCPFQITATAMPDLMPASWYDVQGSGWWWALVTSVFGMLGAFPKGLLYGIPAVAAYTARRSDRFVAMVWTEWIALGCAIALAIVSVVQVAVGGSAWYSTEGVIERVVHASTFVVLILLSRLLVNSGLFNWTVRAQA